MIELYTHPMSPCAQKVRIVLSEKQLDWSAIYVDLAKKENLTAQYLQLNPLGVVPTLVHNDKAIIESSIICEYLDDAFPDKPLTAATPYERAQMRFWMKHVDTKLHPSCGALQWPILMRPALMKKSEEERNQLLEKIPEKPRRERQKRLVKMGLEAPDVIDSVKTYRSTILKMEQALSQQEWIVSNDFTLADICLAPYFQTIYQFGWQELFFDCPNVARWFEKCMERASYQEAVLCDFDDDVIKNLREKGLPAWQIIKQHLADLRNK